MVFLFSNSLVVYLFNFLRECDVSERLGRKARYIYTRVMRFFLGFEETDNDVFASLAYLSHFFSLAEMLTLLGAYGFTRRSFGISDPFTLYHVSTDDFIVYLDPHALPEVRVPTIREVINSVPSSVTILRSENLQQQNCNFH